MGHPKPFGLNMIAVGNEENLPNEYFANYLQFRDAIKAKYPDVTVISNSGPDDMGVTFDNLWAKNKAAGSDMVDEHYYNSPSWFLQNNGRYDAYDRNGPKVFLGEYASLTDEERRAVAETAVWAVGDLGVTVVGVHAPGSHQARIWTEHARDIGADAVLCLPPTTYRASRTEIVDHFATVAAVGLPVMVYNNPIDTKVDLTPDVLAEISQIEHIVAVKEFSGDVRRILEIRERAPSLAVSAGADDLLLEAVLMGATGWFAGFPNVFPAESVRLFELARSGELPRRAGSTNSSSRPSVGTRAPSSCKRSSTAWISSTDTAVHAVRRAGR